MNIEVNKPTEVNLTLGDIEPGQAAWIPLDGPDIGDEWCLVLRTDVGYAALRTGFTKYPGGCLDYPAIPANVKIVED